MKKPPEPQQEQPIPTQTEGKKITKKDQAGKIQPREIQPCPDCGGVA